MTLKIGGREMGSCSSYPMVWLSRVQVSGILLYFVQDKLEKDVASFQTGILCVFPCWIVVCVSDATVICRIPLGLCGQKSYNIKCAKMVPSRKFKHKFCLYLLTGFIHFNSCFPILQGWRFPLNLRRSS